MKIITDERCMEYSKRGHPERPLRIQSALDALRRQDAFPIDWAAPDPAGNDVLLRAHAKEHLAEVEHPQFDFDGDTPAYSEIDDHARRSAGGALAALDAALKGEKAFSLLRPPGHHATRDRAMGFCYLNSIAAAVLEARSRDVDKVAVFDFDVHHGNGTEAILLGQGGVAFFSVHQHPAYPGTGQHSYDNARNYPTPPGASRELYRSRLEQAFADIMKFKPDLIAVSAGFDAYAHDPLSDEPLEHEDFHWLGTMIRDSGIPAFSILEGGYSHALGELIVEYLKGWEGKGRVRSEGAFVDRCC